MGQQQNQRATQLFNETEPGLRTAEAHYQKLASGDPKAIFKEVAPSAEMIAQNAKQTKDQIKDSVPRGGVKDLALAETDINKSAQIGGMESAAYEHSFADLASLGEGGVSLSINEVSNAIAAFGGASHTVGDVAHEQAAGKAAQLGFFGSLAGGAGELAAA